ncbi:MAG TPA: amidohydrolase family protein [Povalibacter sp.]|uniref:amidohydrolase family protein n=1 Tax=Povalibacter sp. TaxID=1962978 RepID=UPI002C64C3D8|nr:amidohydrolase family protein [Povalibacter sp.]HMN44582.1 amidohydrolase family protein [Povalibacter sp.]
MTYATHHLCCDADSHIMETVDWIARHADPTIRERLPELSLAKSGTKSYDFIHDAVDRQQQRARSGETPRDVVKGVKGWNAYGAFDPRERSRALDDLGFARQLVFSTFSGSQYLQHADMDVRYGGIRAHNRAMAEFCGGDARLIAVGQLSLADPQRCVEELREGARLGCGAFWIPAMPVEDRSPGHPDFDAVWRTLSELNLPFMLHVGPNSAIKIAAYENNGKPRPKDITGAEQGENLRVRDFMVLSIAPQQFLTALVFDGVFERFPALRAGVIELGAGWVPEYLRTLDMSQKIFKRTDESVASLPMKASDYIRRAVRFTPFPGEDVGRMIRDAGADLFLFSSDYPHPEGTDDPIGRFERTFGDLSESDRRKFYVENFQMMMDGRLSA